MATTWPWIRAAGPIVGGAILWLQYFDLKDGLRPEPRRMILLGFVAGALAAPVASLAYKALGWLGVTTGTTAPGETAYLLGVVGPVEEGAKFLAAWLFCFRSRHFDEPIDGLVYAAAVSVGFASIENALYAGLVSWPIQLARAATTPLTHSVFASLWGFGAGKALLGPGRPGARAFWIVVPLAAAALAHGLYDAALVTLGVPSVASGVVLVLWAFLIRHARALVRGRSGARP